MAQDAVQKAWELESSKGPKSFGIKVDESEFFMEERGIEAVSTGVETTSPVKDSPPKAEIKKEKKDKKKKHRRENKEWYEDDDKPDPQEHFKG